MNAERVGQRAIAPRLSSSSRPKQHPKRSEKGTGLRPGRSRFKRARGGENRRPVPRKSLFPKIEDLSPGSSPRNFPRKSASENRRPVPRKSPDGTITPQEGSRPRNSKTCPLCRSVPFVGPRKSKTCPPEDLSPRRSPERGDPASRGFTGRSRSRRRKSKTCPPFVGPENRRPVPIGKNRRPVPSRNVPIGTHQNEQVIHLRDARGTEGHGGLQERVVPTRQ